MNSNSIYRPKGQEQTRNFGKIKALTTLLCLAPIVMYLIMWDSLPEQMRANVMTNPLMLPRIVVALVIPIGLAIVHFVVTFVISSQVKDNPKVMWCCLIMPIVAFLANIPILLMNI